MYEMIERSECFLLDNKKLKWFENSYAKKPSDFFFLKIVLLNCRKCQPYHGVAFFYLGLTKFLTCCLTFLSQLDVRNFNPLLTSRLVHVYNLDESITSFRGFR